MKVNRKDLIQFILGIMGALAFFVMVGYIISKGLPEMSKETAFIVGNVTAVVSMIAKDIYSYYFGSSSGSKEKSEQLKNIK